MKLIPLTQGQFAMVDDEDYDFLMQWKWHADYGNNTGYARRSTKKGGISKAVLMHHALVGFIYGLVVDHIDGNGINNQRSNLRHCTHAQNLQNMRPKKGGSSKYLGVSKSPTPNRWIAAIKGRYIGSFHFESNAAQAYNREAEKMYGVFANLNQLPQPIEKEPTKQKTSTHKGVSWDTRKNKWLAQIRINKRYIFLGYFDSETDAASIYNNKKNKNV